MQQIELSVETPEQASATAAFIAGLVKSGVTFTARSLMGSTYIRITFTGGY